MAGEWDRVDKVPVELPDGQVVGAKLWVPLSDIASSPSREIPNPGRQPLLLAEQIGGDEFFRLCMLNAGRLYENGFDFMALEKVRIASR